MEKRKIATHHKWLLSGLKLYSIIAFIALIIIIGCIVSYLYAVTHGWNFTITDMKIVKQSHNTWISLSYKNPNRFSITFNITQISFSNQNEVVIWTYNTSISFDVPRETNGNRDLYIIVSEVALLFPYLNQTVSAHVMGQVAGVTCWSFFNQTIPVSIIGG